MKSLKLQQVGMEIDEKQKLAPTWCRNGISFCFWICAVETSCRNSYEVQNDRRGFVLCQKNGRRELEQNITRFLLELGSGFAFIGRQKEVIVAGKTRKIDMLFYHIKLRCYVVVELKAVSFEPEFDWKTEFLC